MHRYLNETRRDGDNSLGDQRFVAWLQSLTLMCDQSAFAAVILPTEQGATQVRVMDF